LNIASLGRAGRNVAATIARTLNISPARKSASVKSGAFASNMSAKPLKATNAWNSSQTKTAPVKTHAQTLVRGAGDSAGFVICDA